MFTKIYKSVKEHFNSLNNTQLPECPDCGSQDWLSGTEGGLNTNVCCDNCKSAFNVVLGLDFYYGCDSSRWERIGNSWFIQ